MVLVRYNNGDAIPTEVVDAQTALTTAEVRYYASVYSYLAGLSRLEYAQGGDLRKRSHESRNRRRPTTRGLTCRATRTSPRRPRPSPRRVELGGRGRPSPALPDRP